MTASLVASPVSADQTTRRRHARLRTGAVAGGIALLIVAGSYEAATKVSHAVYPPTSSSAGDDHVQPSRAVMREMRSSVVGQYGTRAPATRAGRAHAQDAGTEVGASRAVMQELQTSIAGQYGFRH